MKFIKNILNKINRKEETNEKVRRTNCTILARKVKGKEQYLCSINLPNKGTHYYWNDRFTTSDICRIEDDEMISVKLSNAKNMETGIKILDEENTFPLTMTCGTNKKDNYDYRIYVPNECQKFWSPIKSEKCSTYIKAMNRYEQIEKIISNVAITCIEWEGFHFFDKKGRYCILFRNGEVQIDMQEKIWDRGNCDWVTVKMSDSAITLLRAKNLID